VCECQGCPSTGVGAVADMEAPVGISPWKLLLRTPKEEHARIIFKSSRIANCRGVVHRL